MIVLRSVFAHHTSPYPEVGKRSLPAARLQHAQGEPWSEAVRDKGDEPDPVPIKGAKSVAFHATERCARMRLIPTGAPLLPMEAVAPGKPDRTLARDDRRERGRPGTDDPTPEQCRREPAAEPDTWGSSEATAAREPPTPSRMARQN